VNTPETLAAPNQQTSIAHPSFTEAFRFWLKLGFISFGGPTGQIAIMQTELVEKKRWISQSRQSIKQRPLGRVLRLTSEAKRRQHQISRKHANLAQLTMRSCSWISKTR